MENYYIEEPDEPQWVLWLRIIIYVLSPIALLGMVVAQNR